MYWDQHGSHRQPSSKLRWRWRALRWWQSRLANQHALGPSQKKYGMPIVHGGYQELVEDESLDGIYNPLVPAEHGEWSVRALEAAKRVLREKPFSRNGSEAEAMVVMARATNRILMEAFHWRYHPLHEVIDRSLGYARASPRCHAGMRCRSERFFWTARRAEKSGVHHAPV